MTLKLCRQLKRKNLQGQLSHSRVVCERAETGLLLLVKW